MRIPYSEYPKNAGLVGNSRMAAFAVCQVEQMFIRSHCLSNGSVLLQLALRGNILCSFQDLQELKSISN